VYINQNGGYGAGNSQRLGLLFAHTSTGGWLGAYYDPLRKQIGIMAGSQTPAFYVPLNFEQARWRGNWFHLGLDIKIAVDGFVDFYIGTERVAAWVGILSGGVDALYLGGTLKDPSNTSQANWRSYALFDDFYVDTGALADTREAPPTHRFQLAMPNRNTLDRDWDPVGAATNWQAVSSTDASGDDSYVTSDTPAARDIYRMAPLPKLEGYVPTLVRGVVRARSVGHAPLTVLAGVGQVYSEDDTLATTDNFEYYYVTFTSLPGSLAWSDQYIRRLEMGIQRPGGP
jgi:hypothetical protein